MTELKRVSLEITEGLAEAMDAACNGRPRNPTVEEWLWRLREIKSAAKREGITRQPRRKRGRPKR